jgi:hypothetical protein
MSWTKSNVEISEEAPSRFGNGQAFSPDGIYSVITDNRFATSMYDDKLGKLYIYKFDEISNDYQIFQTIDSFPESLDRIVTMTNNVIVLISFENNIDNLNILKFNETTQLFELDKLIELTNLDGVNVVGRSVSITDDSSIITVSTRDNNGVLIYELDNDTHEYQLIQQLIDTTNDVNISNFGFYSDISGNGNRIGVNYFDTSNNESKIRFFDRINNIFIENTDEILVNDINRNYHFEFNTQGNRIIIQEELNNDNNFVVYELNNNSWTIVGNKIPAFERSNVGNASISGSGNRIITSDSFGTFENSNGIVQIYELQNNIWTQQFILTDEINNILEESFIDDRGSILGRVTSISRDGTKAYFSILNNIDEIGFGVFLNTLDEEQENIIIRDPITNRDIELSLEDGLNVIIGNVIFGIGCQKKIYDIDDSEILKTRI